MPRSCLQWPSLRTVATSKAIWCLLQTTDPFLSPEKAGQKSRCGVDADDRLLLQGKALLFPLPVKQGMLGKSHMFSQSSVLSWFPENSLKRKPGVLHCSPPSPKAKQIETLGREGTLKPWSHQPPLSVRALWGSCKGHLSDGHVSPRLVFALTCALLLTLPAYSPCMNNSDFPFRLPQAVHPGLVLGDSVLLWIWLPLTFAYFSNMFLKSFSLAVLLWNLKNTIGNVI